MGLRRAHCYHWDSQPYTRVSKNPSTSFITGIPGIKITKFDMGELNGDWDIRVELVCIERIQMRHNALEAARQTAVRCLEKALGKNSFHFKLHVYPHHVMRENKMATGAGADRVQSGMRESFGKPVGKAARVNVGQAVFSVEIPREKEAVAREALRKANAKLPGKCTIETVVLKEPTEDDTDVS